MPDGVQEVLERLRQTLTRAADGELHEVPYGCSAELLRQAAEVLEGGILKQVHTLTIHTIQPFLV